jgi:hypothetical protein
MPHLFTTTSLCPQREARLRADNDKLREELDYLRQCVGHDKVAAPSTLPTPMPTHHHGGTSTFTSYLLRKTATPNSGYTTFSGIHPANLRVSHFLKVSNVLLVCAEAFAMVDDHNSSMSTSFLSTCESMEIDEQTAGSPGTHDDSMFSRNNGKEPARTPTIPTLSTWNQP